MEEHACRFLNKIRLSKDNVLDDDDNDEEDDFDDDIDVENGGDGDILTELTKVCAFHCGYTVSYRGSITLCVVDFFGAWRPAKHMHGNTTINEMNELGEIK